MIKKATFLVILILLTSVNAVYTQENTHKIVIKYGKHPEFYRFVLICEKPEIAYSINVNLLKDGKIKLSFTNPFEIEFEGRILSNQDTIKDFKITKENKTLVLETSNIDKMKVSRYESPPRLVIDAYIDTTVEEKTKRISVLIDPGHGGQDHGLQSKENNEKNLTLYISKEIASRLTQKGIKTSLTRQADEDLSLKRRLKIENRLKPSLFLSIHLSTGDYFVIYTSPIKKNISKDDPSKVFVTEDNLVKNFKNKLRENFSEPLYIEKLPITLLKEAYTPSLIIELPRRALFSDKNYTNRLIEVIVQAILENFKLNIKIERAKNE